MAMPAAARTDWTASDVRRLNDESGFSPRYEVVDGELLVTPAPRPTHQYVVMALLRRLSDWTIRDGRAFVVSAPADLEFSPTRYVQPDIFVAPRVDGRRPRERYDVRSLLLAVEVLSPSTARADRQIKRRMYQGESVPEYWIVDADARLIERWHPSDTRAELMDDTLGWQPFADGDPFTLDLPAYFREVWDEDLATFTPPTS